MTNRIICPGFIPNEIVPLYLKACDFCVYPSIAEGFGVAIVEAMASGLPTVIFESVYIEEFGKNILVAKDGPEFICHVKNLVENEDYRKDLSQKCKDDTRKLSIENIAQKYVKTFAELCQ